MILRRTRIILALLCVIATSACTTLPAPVPPPPPPPGPVGGCYHEFYNGTYEVTRVIDGNGESGAKAELSFRLDEIQASGFKFDSDKRIILDKSPPGTKAGQQFRGTREYNGGPCPPQLTYALVVDGVAYYPRVPLQGE